MTTSNNPMFVHRPRRKAGFTLVEVMVVVALSALIAAMAMPTLLFFSKSMLGVGNYGEMSSRSRTALEVFSRDLHAAETIIGASGSSLTVTLPPELSSATVAYTYSSANKELTRTETPASGTATSRVLFGDVVSFAFVYYNRLGVDVTSSASVLTESKSVQINAQLLKSVLSVDNTDYIISARFLMRNI